MRNNDGYQVVNECLKDLLRDRAFLMKAFISNVDTAIGHNLSRLLSLTPVGSRNEENEEEEDDAKKEVEDGKNESTEGKPKDKYVITGTLLYSETPLQFQIPKMVESGDKKKDASRRLAIEKYAIPNSKPNWVAETINVRYTNVRVKTRKCCPAHC
jgi:adenylate kinase